MRVRENSAWNRVVNIDGVQPPWPTERVEMVRLDSFCEEHDIVHIHFLKTDCEGYDLEVLQGAERMLRSEHIDCVFCEINFRRTDEHGDFFRIESFLSQFSFVFLHSTTIPIGDLTCRRMASRMLCS